MYKRQVNVTYGRLLTTSSGRSRMCPSTHARVTNYMKHFLHFEYRVKTNTTPYIVIQILWLFFSHPYRREKPHLIRVHDKGTRANKHIFPDVYGTYEEEKKRRGNKPYVYRVICYVAETACSSHVRHIHIPRPAPRASSACRSYSFAACSRKKTKARRIGRNVLRPQTVAPTVYPPSQTDR